MPANTRFSIDIAADDKSAKGVKSAEKGFQRLGKTADKVNKGSLAGLADGSGVKAAAAGVADKAVAHLNRIADAGDAGTSSLKTLTVAGRAAQSSLEGIASSGGPIIATVVGLGIAATKFASAWANGGASIARTSATIGVAAGDLQKFQGAFEQFGVSKDDTTAALGGIASTLHEAKYGRDNTAAAAMGQLGLKPKYGANGNPDISDFTRQLMNVLSSQSDPWTQARIAGFFGATSALPALRQGSGVINKAMADVSAHAAVMPDADLPRATSMNQKGVQLGQRAQKAAMLAGKEAAPKVDEFMDGLLGNGAGGHAVSMGVQSATRAIGGALTTAAGDASRALHGLASAGLSFLDRIEHLGERSRQDQVSPKGARGVMQLMPGTARDVARSLGQPFDDARYRSDAGYSRMLGGEYLSQQLRRYGGDETLATAAYNGGPGNVDRWIKRYGDPRKGQITDEQFAADIPFRETRDYVSRVEGPQRIHLTHEFRGLPAGATVKTTRKGSNEVAVARAMPGG